VIVQIRGEGSRWLRTKTTGSDLLYTACIGPAARSATVLKHELHVQMRAPGDPVGLTTAEKLHMGVRAAAGGCPEVPFSFAFP
jgi:hypothetical protein